MLCFSKRKWNNLTIECKLSIWFDHFLYIEKTISEKQEIKPELFEQMKLLENETDDRLKIIFSLTQNDDLNDIYSALREIFYEEIVAQKDFHFLNQQMANDNPKIPVIVILDNLRSAFNVGSIIRTAECLSVEGVWFCGYTPKPTHPKVKNTAMGTEKFITWRYFQDTTEAIVKAHELGYQVYAIETGEDAVSIYTHDYSEKFALVMGNEALGIDNQVLLQCDKKLNIPISGWKKSLNVSTAFAVVCCEIARILGG